MIQYQRTPNAAYSSTFSIRSRRRSRPRPAGEAAEPRHPSPEGSKQPADDHLVHVVGRLLLHQPPVEQLPVVVLGEARPLLERHHRVRVLVGGPRLAHGASTTTAGWGTRPARRETWPSDDVRRTSPVPLDDASSHVASFPHGSTPR